MREFIAQANCEIFKKIHFEIQRWAKIYASKFKVNKYQLMHFWFKKRGIKKIRNNDLNAKLNLKTHKIESREKAKLLNINFDFELKWIIHIQLLKAKAIMKLNGLTCCVKSIKNILYQELRKLYQDMILFTLLFECSVWYISLIIKYKDKEKSIMKILRVIQKRAIYIISKGFKNISEVVLNVECY